MWLPVTSKTVLEVVALISRDGERDGRRPACRRPIRRAARVAVKSLACGQRVRVGEGPDHDGARRDSLDPLDRRSGGAGQRSVEHGDQASRRANQSRAADILHAERDREWRQARAIRGVGMRSGDDVGAVGLLRDHAGGVWRAVSPVDGGGEIAACVLRASASVNAPTGAVNDCASVSVSGGIEATRSGASVMIERTDRRGGGAAGVGDDDADGVRSLLQTCGCPGH